MDMLHIWNRSTKYILFDYSYTHDFTDYKGVVFEALKVVQAEGEHVAHDYEPSIDPAFYRAHRMDIIRYDRTHEYELHMDGRIVSKEPLLYYAFQDYENEVRKLYDPQ